MILRVITWIIVGGVIYSLLNRYILPIFYRTANTDDRLRDMQKQMQELNKKLDKSEKARKKNKEGDFIDYEEIK
jgi:uncharacterized membrane protein (DUF106 family)